MKPKLRRHDQGPLAITEFRGKPGRFAPGSALTMTRVMFTYEFQMKKLANDQHQAELSSLDAFAVFLPDESWCNDIRAGTALLDHEQGHFDIAHVAAQRINVAVLRMFKAKKSISAVGSSAVGAKRVLAEKLETLIRVADQQAAEENRIYDARTRHGLSRNEQAEYRRIQALTLARLKKELSKAKF